MNHSDNTPPKGTRPRRAGSSREESKQSLYRTSTEQTQPRQAARRSSDRNSSQQPPRRSSDGNASQQPPRRTPSDGKASGQTTRKASAARESSGQTRNRTSSSTVRRNSNKKRTIYRKSAYYRRRQRNIRIISGIAALLFLLLLIFLIRGCAGCGKDTSVASSSQSAGSVSPEDTDSGRDTADGDKTADTEGGTSETDEASALPAEPVTLTVTVVGDCTLGTDEYFDYDSSLNAYYYSYGKEYFLQNVKSIFSADDLTIANFEGTLTDLDTRADKQFAFKAPAEFAGILSCSSVETVNTANNHSHDYGEQSFSDTMAALDTEGIVHFGYDETAVVEVKGIKVGLVGIYELDDHLERTEQLKKNIAKVKAEGAQLTIVIFHWGNELETVPDTNQMTLGRLAIDKGADLVCGHHPHVLQGIEEYKGRNIVYSLGNFCFGGNTYPSDMDTMIFQQTFTIDKDGVKMDNITNIIPCSVSSEYGYNNYQPTPAEGEDATRIMNKIQERSSWIPLPEISQNSNGTQSSDSTQDSQESTSPEADTGNAGTEQA